MRVAISAAIIRNGRILLVRNENTWTPPGGKPKEGETDLECLSREVREELEVDLQDPSFFAVVQGETPHTGDVIEARIYLAEIVGEPRPSAEISDFAWVGRDDSGYNISEPTRLVLQILSSKGYL